jgi:hypothetical protein
MKLVKEHIILEKFELDSDPVEDLGIGLRGLLKKEYEIIKSKSNEEKASYIFNNYRLQAAATCIYLMIREASKGENDLNVEFWNNIFLINKQMAALSDYGVKIVKKYFKKKFDIKLTLNEYRKKVNEKFIEDSDPIHDLRIGLPALKEKWEEELPKWRGKCSYIYKNKCKKYCNNSFDQYYVELTKIICYTIADIIKGYPGDSFQNIFDEICRIELQNRPLNRYKKLKIRSKAAEILDKILDIKVNPSYHKKKINEKFTQDNSDPIKDLNIGIDHPRNFKTKDELTDWVLKNLLHILGTNKIPRDIIYDRTYYLKKEYVNKIRSYTEKYFSIGEKSFYGIYPDWYNLRKIFEKRKYKYYKPNK